MTISVLIVDDQHLVRSGFRMLIDATDGMQVVGEASTGREALDRAHRLKPDVVIMDIRMPEMDGLEATRRLSAWPVERRPRVLMLTTFEVDEYLFAALQAGASGFLLKDAPPAQLVDAIRVIAGGDALLGPSLTRTLIEQYAEAPPAHASASDSAAAPRLAELTAREREVLELIADGRSNAEVAQALFLSEATVKSHVTKLLAKLDVRDRVQAVIFAYESGVVTPRRDDAPRRTDPSPVD